jgi:small subunit ribosomal protein S4
MQLREKQKVKRLYGLSEKQFRLFFHRSEQQKGVTGTNLLVMLERRLDNVVYRMGFANSRTEGRHFVRHRHFQVNGHTVDIPSYIVQPGDVIELRESSKNVKAIQDSTEAVVRRGIPQWLELKKETLSGVVKSFPTRDDITMPIMEQLIVELYSK